LLIAGVGVETLLDRGSGQLQGLLPRGEFQSFQIQTPSPVGTRLCAHAFLAPASPRPLRLSRRSRYFGASFVGERTSTLSAGKEKVGKSGYYPAGVMDWQAIHVARPEERKKVARKTRMLLPLTDDAVRNHLTGKQTIGIYALLPVETCWFLALDFDKKSWMADACAFLATCRHFQVPAAVERSRSGNGAHVWTFFDRPVLATDARRLGCALPTQGRVRKFDRFAFAEAPERTRQQRIPKRTLQTSF